MMREDTDSGPRRLGEAPTLRMLVRAEATGNDERRAATPEASCAVEVRFRSADEERPPAAEAPVEACPKCGERVAPAMEDCRRCGLRRAHFAGFARDDQSAASAALRRAWLEVEAHWEDEERHERFLEQAVSEVAFAFAARCYRQARHVRGDESIDARLARITRMAEATLLSVPLAGKVADEPQPYRRLMAMLIALVLLAGVGGFYVLLKGGRAQMATQGSGATHEPAGHTPISPSAAPSFGDPRALPESAGAKREGR